jgi:hypothetical protein
VNVTSQMSPARTEYAPGPQSGSGTRRLLACGIVAGPIWVLTVLLQGLSRSGYNFTHDAPSLLDLGSLGWIQWINFVVTGGLFVVAAVGVRRSTKNGAGRTWMPRLLVIVGAGTIGGGLFHPDPSGGYPPGIPAGPSATYSWHGVLHMVCGFGAFIAMIAFCFVLARRLSALGRLRMAACSRIIGVACAVGAAGSVSPRGALALYAGISLAFLWISAALFRILVSHDVGHAPTPDDAGADRQSS